MQGYANVYGVATAHYSLATESKMITTSQISSSRIARREEQGARPAIPTQVSVDKLATKCKNQIKSIPNVFLMKASIVLRVATFNVRTLKNENKIYEIIAIANATQLDII